MTKRVYSDGSPDSKVAIVCEAPAKDELRIGKPLVGMSGKLNDTLLLSGGLSRNECYLTNVWKSEIKKNDKTGKFPYDYIIKHKDEYEEYKELLKLELEQCKANLIIAMGELSLFTLTGQKGIVKRRGSIYPSTLIPGRKTMAMRHPSAALPFRNYCLQYVIVKDYIKAKRESEFPEIRLPKRELLINPTFSEIHEEIRYFYKFQRTVAFDIEVINEEVSHIAFSDRPEESLCIPFFKHGENVWSLEEEAEIWEWIAKLLENPDIVKVGQNLAFDTTFLFRKYGIVTRNIRDTMVGMGILYSGMPTIMKYKGLDFITSIYTDENYYKDEGKKYFKLQFDEDVFQEYNAKDAAICIEAEPKIAKDLEQQGNLETYEITCKLIEPFTYMGEHGVRVNEKELKRARGAAGANIEVLKAELNELASKIYKANDRDERTLNPSSPKQLKEYFYELCGFQRYVSRSGPSKGNVTVDVNALKRLARKGSKEAKLILAIRHIAKRKSTYYDVTIKDGRFRFGVNVVGTKQGRVSSSKNIFGEGTNSQNLPDEMKRLLIADEGCVLFNVDLEQAENRIVSYIAPDPTMIEVFEDGTDLHKQTASFIFDKSVGEVTDEVGTCPICVEPSTCGHKGERFWGKKANHSLNYGEGYRLFSFINEIPETTGRRIVEGYHTLYPGIRNYWEWVERKVRQTRTLTNFFGRTFYFMDVITHDMLKQAYSFIPQSTVPDIINRWGVLYLWENFREVELLLQVHDSIAFQIPIKVGWERIAEILWLLRKQLEQPLTWRASKFIIPIECEIGFNMKETRPVDLKSLNLARHLQDTYDSMLHNETKR